MTSYMVINLVALSAIISIALMAMLVAVKLEKINQLKATIDKLKKSIDEMDEQAKLIVHTDMELNKTQEELDKKLSGLYALQRLSRAIAATLEENQIFKIMQNSGIEDLGFEKACGFLWSDKEEKFILQLNMGYDETEIDEITNSVLADRHVYLGLMEDSKTLSAISMQGNTALADRIKFIFKVTSFIISPVLPKEGQAGFLFCGTQNPDTAITEGDEELITILGNQIGQALENARLFEKTWQAHQELEKKVEERTRELKAALDEVKRASKRKTDFISAVSHELRTPLTSIKGYASLLLTGKLGTLPDEVRLRLEKINRHSDELTYLVNDLLDISRIESGRITMKYEPLDLKKVVEGVLDLLSVQLKEKQITTPIDIPEDLITVLADRGQLNRVFINIIGNAIKFTPQKGKISIASHNVPQGIQIDVADTGCGIPEEAREVIFEEFYRVDNAINQEVKGTGLGLALVKHIIEAHSGKIWVKSKIGGGSTFSFILPHKE